MTYTVTRLNKKKKRNNSFVEGVEVEEIHHHPTNLQCDCCQNQLHEIGSTVAREEATFIPAKLVRVQHIEHAYECKQCKKHNEQSAFIQRGKAPTAAIPRSIAGPMVLAKVFGWLEKSQFFGKNALATATEYTLNRRKELKAFLYNGQIEIDNNPAENAIRPTVIGRKNWLFSVSEAGAKGMRFV